MKHFSLFTTFAVILALGILVSPVCAVEIFYVSQNSTATNPDGRSWETAFQQIQPAVDAAAIYGGEIWVAEGTYTSDEQNVVTIPDGCHVYGGFIGTETDRDQRDWINHTPIIDGEGARRGAYIEATESARLDGFIVQNGNYVIGDDSDTSFTYSLGGGIFNYRGTVANITVKNCKAGRRQCISSWPWFPGYTCENNGKGAGIYNDDGVVDYCTVTSCSVIGVGDGIFNDGGVVSECSFRNIIGWAIYNDVDGVVTNSFFENNSVALDNHGEVDGCYFVENEIAVSAYENSVISNSRFFHNEDAFYLLSGAAKNCVIAKNERGVRISDGAFLVNSVIYGNNIGIEKYDTSAIVTKEDIVNCIIWDNDQNDLLPFSYCCFPNVSDLYGNINADPLFVFTDGDNPFAWDFHLQDGSPCIDSGLLLAAPAYDIDESPRPGGDNKVCMGAYESPDEYLPGGPSNERIVCVSVDGDNTDGLTWETAFTDLGTALLWADRDPDNSYTINISEGTYLYNPSDYYELSQRISLVGGWSVSPTFIINDPFTYETVVEIDGTEYFYSYGNIKGVKISGSGTEIFQNLDSGTVEYCTFSQLGLFANRGLALSCRITDNEFDWEAHNTGTLYNCLFYGNRQTADSCLLLSYGSMLHCTVYGNEMNEGVPALINAGEVVNSIVWDDSDIDIQPFHQGVVRYSSFQEADGENGNFPYEPRFVDVSSTDPSQWNLGLANGSVCIDVGTTDIQLRPDFFGKRRPGEDDRVCLGAIESPDEYVPLYYPVPNLPDVFCVYRFGSGEDGKTWEKAFRSLQEGVDAAVENGGGQVWVAGGEYTSELEAVVNIPQNVEVYGGFTGTELHFNQRNWEDNKVVVNAQGARRGVMNHGVLDGVTVKHGVAEDGAGVYNSGTVRNCLIKDNDATGNGGGIYNEGQVYESNIYRNTSENNGGGVYNKGTILDCNIEKNVAGHDGGGVYVFNDAQLQNCTLKENLCDGVGGGCCGWGGEITGCVFLDNTAYSGGGVFLDHGHLSRSEMSGNSASISGGGVYIKYNAGMDNCLVFNNLAKKGGGVLAHRTMISWFDHVYMNINNCTITKNVALEEGGGASYGSDGSSFVHNVFQNCIIWDNYERTTPQLELSHSCTPNGTAETNSIATDPLFIYAEGDDPSLWDFHLQSNSPCRFSGTTEDIPLYDLDGNPRMIREGKTSMGCYAAEIPGMVIFSQ